MRQRQRSELPSLSALVGCPGELIHRARYGVVVRPPQYAWDGNQFVCDQLLDITSSADSDANGSFQIVREANFIGIVAGSLSAAQVAARQLTARWQSSVTDGAPVLSGRSPVAPASSQDDVHHHDYGWPSRMGWGDAPGWVLADCTTDGLHVWAQTVTAALLKEDLAFATGLLAHQIHVVSETSARLCGLGRHCGDDAAVDAALMSHALGCPVAVWLDASYTRDVKALGVSQRISISAARKRDGEIVQYRNQQAHLTGEVPAVGVLLADRLPAWPGDRQVASEADEDPYQDELDGIDLFSPYEFADETLSARNGGVTAKSALEGLGDIQQVFARESFLDEVAHASDEDPIALRLRYMEDVRGTELIHSVSQRAGWGKTPPSDGMEDKPQELLAGRGFAYSQRPDASHRLASGVRSAWIADVDVNRITGNVTLTRLVVGQDAGADVDTARLKQTLQARVLGERFSVLGHEPAFDEWGDGKRVVNTSPDKLGSRTIALAGTSARDIAASTGCDSSHHASTSDDTLSLLPESADLSSGVAVIANALFDATGVRFRQPPFTANRVRAALKSRDAAHDVTQGGPQKDDARVQRRKSSPERRVSKGWVKSTVLTAAASAVAGTVVMAWPWKGAIAPIARPSATLYSADTIERGRLVAAAGDCAACHTAEGGIENAGGHRFDTPFGTLYSTNLTPDEATGIGQWSYDAFRRAMREGVSREGHHLYPAFPYTAFAKVSDADMQALYAYLMAQPAVSASAPANDLTFPFNQRALIAGWNTLYHDTTPFMPDPAQSELYNRGAYLSEGLGHCSACHSPRNALGAERGGKDYLAGAMIDGWEAPALNTLNHSPVAWSEASLYDYLREGKSTLHGVASGPMAPVVAGLAELPEYDVRAIAHYVATQMEAPAGDSPVMLQDAAARVALSQTGPAEREAGERLFDGACASCHAEQLVPSFSSATTSLALNTNLHSASPDNTLHAILGGVHAEHAPGIGNMPGFSGSFTDTQVTTLTQYLQARFAPDSSPWQDVEQRVSAIRKEHHSASSSHP